MKNGFFIGLNHKLNKKKLIIFIKHLKIFLKIYNEKKYNCSSL